MRWICGLLPLLAAASLHAHDIHRSRAEAEYNAKTGKLEVSLTLFASDLELALIRQSERMISLTTTSADEVDAQLRIFLARNFIVTDTAGKAAAIEWTGRRIEADTHAEPEMTLFFEVPLPHGLPGTTLKHVAFCDRFADQLNLVHLKSGTQSTELSFTRNAPTKRLAFGR